MAGEAPSTEVTISVSYGQWYLANGVAGPDDPDVSELVEAAINNGGFAAAPNLAVVLTPDFQYGHVIVAVETSGQPVPSDAPAGMHGRITVAGLGLRVASVDDSGQRVQVNDGTYDFTISHDTRPGGPDQWRVKLFAVLAAPGKPTTPRVRRDTPAAREKRRQRVLDRLADKQNDLRGFKLEEGYNEILDDLAPTIGGRISLYRTGITELPTWLRKCPNLFELLAHDNQLTSLPDWLPDLRLLHRLVLSYNHGLRMLPDVVAEMPRLTRLGLTETGLTEFPPILRAMPNLQKLYLDDTKITRLPDWIGELKELRTLSLARTPMQYLPDTIGDLSNLETINLENSAITTLPETMINMSSLHGVDLSRSHVTSIPTAVIDHFPDGVIDDSETPFGKERRRKH